MEFVVLELDGNGADYLRRKVTAALGGADPGQSDAHWREMAQSVADRKDDEKPRIAHEDEFFTIDRKQRKLIEVAERCALQELAEIAPLLDGANGEVLEEDFFSYLMEPFGAWPPYTSVLRRTTNRSVILYVFERVRIEQGNLRHLKAPQPDPTPAPRAPAGGYITGTMIGKALKAAAGSIASGALGSLGAMVLNLVMKEVFGSDDAQKMIDAIKQVIVDEIETNELSKVEGAISGALQFLTVEYRHHKDRSDLTNVTHRDALYRDLQGISSRFYMDVIGTLKQDKYAIRGLKVFAFGATVHLLITQEMALVDPDYTDPNESGFLLTLRDNARLYHQHVRNSYDRAMRERNNMGVYVEENFICPTTGHCSTSYRWYWTDHVSGESKSGFVASKDPKMSAQEVAEQDLALHRNQVLTDLRTKLGDPESNILAHIGDLEQFSFPSS